MSRETGAPDADHVIVLRTQGAPQRGRMRGRSPRRRSSATAEPVPSVRVSVVRADPFRSREAADAWLGALRADKGALEAEADAAAAILNRFLRAHRAAAADPWARDVSREHALVARVGYGEGDLVAEGRYGSAFELPRRRESPRRRQDLAPAERLAALVGGRERLLACEELVLRARSDLAAGRPREAALQARIALEAVLAELGGEELSGVAGRRAAVAEAANAALAGDPDAELQSAMSDAVDEMERALRRHRLRRV